MFSHLIDLGSAHMHAKNFNIKEIFWWCRAPDSVRISVKYA
jgi:hypothetical protein